MGTVDYEYKSPLQSNLNRNESMHMVRKAPAVAKRIFRTLNDAQMFVDNIYDNATEGIRITILNDYIYIPDENGKKYGDDGYIETTEEGEYSGVYYIKTIGDGVTPGELVKICRGDTAWFQGNAISGESSSRHIGSAIEGDVYLNTQTLDVYMLDNLGVWNKICNLLPQGGVYESLYYKLSTDGVNHPTWDNTWVRANAEGDNIPHNYEDFNGQSVYLWTRVYSPLAPDDEAKYSVAIVYSSLNLGVFELNNIQI